MRAEESSGATPKEKKSPLAMMLRGHELAHPRIRRVAHSKSVSSTKPIRLKARVARPEASQLPPMRCH
jgi:hypothetical protein